MDLVQILSVPEYQIRNGTSYYQVICVLMGRYPVFRMWLKHGMIEFIVKTMEWMRIKRGDAFDLHLMTIINGQKGNCDQFVHDLELERQLLTRMILVGYQGKTISQGELMERADRLIETLSAELNYFGFPKLFG
jgi:hypothetical protein